MPCTLLPPALLYGGRRLPEPSIAERDVSEGRELAANFKLPQINRVSGSKIKGSKGGGGGQVQASAYSVHADRL